VLTVGACNWHAQLLFVNPGSRGCFEGDFCYMPGWPHTCRSFGGGVHFLGSVS
jgi:hypothetical protein